MISFSGTSGLSLASFSGPAARPSESPQEKLFVRLDANHDGSIDQAELTSAMSSTPAAVTSASSILSAASSLDGDGSGTIEMSELQSGPQALLDALRAQIAASESTAAGSHRDRSDEDLFAKIDSNADGAIDESELDAYLIEQTSSTKADDPKGSNARNTANADSLGSIQVLLAQYTSSNGGYGSSLTHSLLSVAA